MVRRSPARDFFPKRIVCANVSGFLMERTPGQHEYARAPFLITTDGFVIPVLGSGFRSVVGLFLHVFDFSADLVGDLFLARPAGVAVLWFSKLGAHGMGRWKTELLASSKDCPCDTGEFVGEGHDDNISVCSTFQLTDPRCQHMALTVRMQND